MGRVLISCDERTQDANPPGPRDRHQSEDPRSASSFVSGVGRASDRRGMLAYTTTRSDRISPFFSMLG